MKPTAQSTSARLRAEIFVTGGRSKAQEGILAVWEDGFILWSADHVAAGAPYFCGWQKPARVNSVVISALQQAAKGDWPSRQTHVGPSSRYSVLTLYGSGKPQLYMATWHELFETNPDLVVTAGGVEPVGERSRAEVLATEPASYLKFRRHWQSVKDQLLGLVPAESTPYDPGVQRQSPWQ